MLTVATIACSLGGFVVANTFHDKRAPGASPDAVAVLGYRRGLDGLRAVAVLAVMAYHLDSRLLPGGFLGVELFFVLSGFLITALLLEEHDRRGGVALGRFYARRALRLFPALALVVMACSVWAIVHPHYRPDRGDTLRGLPYVLLYMANWASGVFHVGLGLLDHTWSLAVEEQFYLLWPCAFLLIRLLSRRTAVAVCLGAAVAVAVARGIGFDLMPGWRGFFYTATRLDGLLIGCGLAFARSVGLFDRVPERGARTIGVGGAAVVIGTFILVSGSSSAPYLGVLTLVDVATGAMIVAIVCSPRSAVALTLSAGPLVATGRISYGLYLWQTPLTVVLLGHLGAASLPVKLVVVWPVIFTAATASYFLVERPALRWKARFSPPPTGLEAEAAVSGRPAPV